MIQGRRQPKRRSLAQARAAAEAAITGEPVEVERAAQPKKGRKQTEGQHGRSLTQWRNAAWRRYPLLRWLFHIPNGGLRDRIGAAMLKAEGLLRGPWDYCLPAADPPLRYCGIYLELKAPGREGEKNGGLSDEQVDFGRFVAQHGYCCVVAYGWEQAREALEDYLSGRKVSHEWTPPA